MNTAVLARTAAPRSTMPLAHFAAALSGWGARAGAWIAEQSLDARSRHIAGACDHDDLVRRERDCAEFERRCAAIPLFH